MKSQDTIGTSVFDGVPASPVIDQGKNMTAVADCNNRCFFNDFLTDFNFLGYTDSVTLPMPDDSISFPTPPIEGI